MLKVSRGASESQLQAGGRPEEGASATRRAKPVGLMPHPRTWTQVVVYIGAGLQCIRVLINCETDNIGGIRAIRDECDHWGLSYQVHRGEMDRAHSTIQVHATAENAGWKEARVELSYASMSERDPDPAGTSRVEEAPGTPP